MVVDRPAEDAFRLFTEGIATWWPLQEHAVGAGEENYAASVVFEPRDGRRIYEPRADTPEGDSQTLVELEHRGWEQLGERSERARTEYESGWDNVLGRYAGRSRENGAAIASFVLGIVSLVIPFVGFVGGPVGSSSP